MTPPLPRRQPDRHGDGFVVVEQQGWHVLPRSQPVAARGPRRTGDRVVEGAEPLDVTAYGPVGDAQALGQFGAGPLAPALQQGSSRSSRPGRSFRAVTDTRYGSLEDKMSPEADSVLL